MTPVDVTTYADTVVAATQGVGSGLTGIIIPAVMVVAGGIFALTLGWKLVKRLAGR